MRKDQRFKSFEIDFNEVAPWDCTSSNWLLSSFFTTFV